MNVPSFPWYRTATTRKDLQPDTIRPLFVALYTIRLKVVVYSGIPRLREVLKANFSQEIDLPVIQETDLGLLDDAISLLNPPEVQLRVVEVDTFTVRGHDGGFFVGRGAFVGGEGVKGVMKFASLCVQSAVSKSYRLSAFS